MASSRVEAFEVSGRPPLSERRVSRDLPLVQAESQRRDRVISTG